MKRFRRWIILLVVLVLGFVLGLGTASYLIAHRIRTLIPRNSERVVEVTERFLSKRLDLSEVQEAEMRPILTDLAQDLAALRRENAPRIRDMVDSAVTRARPHLSEGQLERLENMRERWRRWAVRDDSIPTRHPERTEGASQED